MDGYNDREFNTEHNKSTFIGIFMSWALRVSCLYDDSLFHVALNSAAIKEDRVSFCLIYA